MPEVLSEAPNVALLTRYLSALEQGRIEDAVACFDPNAVQEELPNRLYPHGQVRSVAQLLASAEKGRGLLVQRYRLRSALAQGEHLAAELEWTGQLLVPFGELPAGSTLRAQIALFIEFRDGRILSQRNYDCYDPF